MLWVGNQEGILPGDLNVRKAAEQLQICIGGGVDKMPSVWLTDLKKGQEMQENYYKKPCLHFTATKKHLTDHLLKLRSTAVFFFLLLT